MTTIINGSSPSITFSDSTTQSSGIANTTGVVNVAAGGTGQTTYTNGQLLIGNTTGNTLTKATLTAGTGISISNSTGSITITNSSPAPTADTSSIAANGWYKNGATGMIIQWGNFSISAGGNANITLPITFPNAHFTAACGVYMPGNQSYNQAMGFYPNNTSTVQYNNANSGAGGTGYFISIGY
jgi:hypothetical protein